MSGPTEPRRKIIRDVAVNMAKNFFASQEGSEGYGDKELDTSFVVFAQSGPDWTETEIRGWWKDRLFIKVPDCFCSGGVIAELDRRELQSKRYASHDGITYFTPDGKDMEDAAIAKTIAAGQMDSEIFVYYSANEVVDGTFVPRWHKKRVFNMNDRWVFLYFYDGELEYVERNGLDTDWGSSSWPSCWQLYSDAGRRAKQERDEQMAREQARKKAEAEAANLRCLLAMDAETLGISIYSTKEQVLAAFKRLARIQHPDAGGSAEAFQRLARARDRAIAALRQA